MADHRAEINKIARAVHAESVERNTATRPLAMRTLAHSNDIDLLRFMAAELIVVLIDQATRKPPVVRPPDAPDPARGRPKGSTGIPRKGTIARHKWETETDEGRAWAEAMAEIDAQSMAALTETIRASVETYTQAARLEWTQELLDQAFTDASGVSLPWGDATADQHEASAQTLLDKATKPVREAILHKTAAQQLRDAGALTLRHLSEAVPA